MIQTEVVTRYGWMTVGEFTDMVALSQMTPGPIGINSATYVGYTSVVNAGYPEWAGVLGSLLATFSLVLPPFVLMIIILICMSVMNQFDSDKVEKEGRMIV
mgnify:CR=1 FL=1